MLAFDNVRYFELPCPVEPREYVVVEPLRPGPDGAVSMPSAPGLGVELDWQWIERHAFATITLSHKARRQARWQTSLRRPTSTPC